MELKMRGETEEVKWEDIRTSISTNNKTLCDIIDNLNLTKKHSLIRARYPYGANIFSNGILHLADSSGVIAPISSSTISHSIKENFTYRSVPIGVITHNAAETYYMMDNRIITLNLFKPGYIIGLWEFLDPPTSYMVNIWSISAGARTIFMVPKITDAESHAILQKEYNVPRKLSKDLLDHWQIFKSIANNAKSENEWYFELVFFSKAWGESIKKKEKGWEKLEIFFLENGWSQSSYWKNKMTYDLIWEKYINELTQNIVKPNAYDVYSVKHLWLIATGVLAGLKPADSDLTAPIQTLQDVFVTRYGLKLYVPTIMAPNHFIYQEKGSYAYYSLQFPTLLESSPKSKNYPSLLANLKEVKLINEKFIEDALNGNLGIENSLIYDAVKKVKMDYFHSEADGHDGIRNSEAMVQEDKTLLHYLNKTEKMKFSDKSRFVKGCIRISVK